VGGDEQGEWTETDEQLVVLRIAAKEDCPSAVDDRRLLLDILVVGWS
jgi:hypothetical protein